VSTDVSHESSPETIKTEKVVPADSGPKPDERLLDGLTRPAEQLQKSGSDADDEKVKTESVEPQPSHQDIQQEQINKSILDQLTRGSTSQSEDKEQSDKSQAGDSGDA
jgi:hypothetical protein